MFDFGFTGWATRQTAGDLPSGGQLVLKDFSASYSFSPDTIGNIHGTACAEIAYDMAPGSKVYLYAFSTDVEFGNAVNDYITDPAITGKKVASMSIGWVNAGPYDGTGSINTIVNNAQAAGIFWANSAGNSQKTHYSGTSAQYNNGDSVAFGAGNIEGYGSTPGLVYNISTGTRITAFLEWNDWNAGRTGNQNHIDYDVVLYRYDTGLGTWVPVTGSYNRQCTTTATPSESIAYTVPANGPYNYGVVIQRYQGGGVCPNSFGHWLTLHSFLSKGASNLWWYVNNCNSVTDPGRWRQRGDGGRHLLERGCDRAALRPGALQQLRRAQCGGRRNARRGGQQAGRGRTGWGEHRDLRRQQRCELREWRHRLLGHVGRGAARGGHGGNRLVGPSRSHVGAAPKQHPIQSGCQRRWRYLRRKRRTEQPLRLGSDRLGRAAGRRAVGWRRDHQQLVRRVQLGQRRGARRRHTDPLNATSTKNATVDGAVSAASLTMDSGYTGVVTLGGSLTVSGDLALNSGSLDVSVSDYPLTIGGNFTRSGGTFAPHTGTVTFNGIGTKSIAGDTTFYNLVVGSGLTLATSNNVTVGGALTNSGSTQETKSVGGVGLLSFGLANIGVNVTSAGSLSSLAVLRHDQSYSGAPPGILTGKYWTITPTGTNYGVGLTLPHNGLANPSVCRKIGDSWDCTYTSRDGTTVTRSGVVELSDWALGTNIQAAVAPSVAASLDLSWNSVLDWTHIPADAGGYDVARGAPTHSSHRERAES